MVDIPGGVGKGMPVTFPLDTPVDPKLATPEELMARGTPITFPLTERATPAELSARKKVSTADSPAQTAKTHKSKAHGTPAKTAVKIQELSPDDRAKAKGLIATDVKPRARLFGTPPSQGYVATPSIERGVGILVSSDSADASGKIKADEFRNYKQMDPATRDSHIGKGKVLIQMGERFFIVDGQDHGAIGLLTEKLGGRVVARGD